MGQLFVVSTPIGNLSDITFRAVEVLRSVGRILAEDTRRTAILCKRHQIYAPLVSAHEHNEAARAEQVLGWLEQEGTVALVADAGTPLLSDPGLRIVRRALEEGHEVVPVPGPSALLAALVGSGLDPEPFSFFGFLPRRGRARRERLEQIARLGHTAVLYEAPPRLVSLLEDLAGVCGPEREVAVGRELTKLHESFVRGTLQEAAAYYQKEKPRGEIVLVLSGGPAAESAEAAETEVAALARDLLAAGMSPSTAARELAKRTGIPRNRAYRVVLGPEGEDSGEPA